jgi:hypothetical protein
MNAIVGAHLTRIPRGPMPQGLLRAAFQHAMMNSMGRNPQIEGSVGDILGWCIGILEPLYPGHTFEYDQTYFGAAAG